MSGHDGALRPTTPPANAAAPESWKCQSVATHKIAPRRETGTYLRRRAWLAQNGDAATADPTAARIAQAIDGFPIVSCDIFDTAVMRQLARPEDVHLATGARAAAKGLTTCRAEAFREYRLAAESAARAELVQANDDEIAIATVYQRLQASGVVTDAAAAASLEFATERAICRPVAAVLAALAARRPGQRLIFLSDSMLPADWLATILADCGYGDLLEVICSAEVRRTKARGGLFAHLVGKAGMRHA